MMVFCAPWHFPTWWQCTLQSYIGALSAFCGVVTAACGAGRGITWMAGGTREQVGATVVETRWVTWGGHCVRWR